METFLLLPNKLVPDLAVKAVKVSRRLHATLLCHALDFVSYLTFQYFANSYVCLIVNHVCSACDCGKLCIGKLNIVLQQYRAEKL